MATLQEYLRKLSTSQLQALLREEIENRGALPEQAILELCEILSERNPNLPTVKQTLLSLCHAYLES